MNINYLDIGLLVFLLGFGVMGFIIGFTEKVFSIISWGGAAILSYYTYDWVRPWVQTWIEKPSVATMVTSVGLFIIYLALFSLLSKGLDDRIQKSMFKKADRYLGLLLGMATGYLVLTLATLICRTVIPNSQYPEWSKNSILWSSAEKGGNFIESFLPLRKPTTTFFHIEKPKTMEPSKSSKQSKPVVKKLPIAKTVQKTVKSDPKPHVSIKKIPANNRSYSAEDRKELNTLVKEYT